MEAFGEINGQEACQINCMTQIRNWCLTMLLRLDWDMLPVWPAAAAAPTEESWRCWADTPLETEIPFVFERGAEEAPPGTCDMALGRPASQCIPRCLSSSSFKGHQALQQ